jgi:hypothetical protein
VNGLSKLIFKNQNSQILFMISESELTRFVKDEDRLIVELLARGILYSYWTCEDGRDHQPSVRSRLFFCYCSRRRISKSIYSRSFFENTRITIAKIFHLAYDWLIGVPATACSLHRAVSKQTVYKYYRYFRQLIESSLSFAPVRVGGIGVAVEVDEMFVRFDRTSKTEVWVIGALERTARKLISLSVLKSKLPEDIVDALSRTILPGSLLVTDFLPSYSLVAKTLNLPHTRVNKTRSYVDPSTRQTTNRIEATWKQLRLFLTNRQNIQIETVLAEFQWRRFHRNNLWEGFLQALATVDWNLATVKSTE